MQSKCWFLPGIIGLLSYQSLSAEVTLDGTLGPAAALPGPNYQIGADVGQQHGGNLFHSFRDFNLQSHESATFSGPDNVQNIISRVTGGNPSNIDGTLRSTIPNADLYFLNPYGIMFGPNAKLEVQGGFHASTADYLRLSDGGRFEARVPKDSLLTVAPIAAFGFLTDSPSTIGIRDNQLSVPENQTFSLIGGDIQIQGSKLAFGFFSATDSDPLAGIYEPILTADTALLSAASGRIYLASVVGSGEVMPRQSSLIVSTTLAGGKITLNHAVVTVSGHQGGSLFIHGDLLEMTHSALLGDTIKHHGGLLDVRVNDFFMRGGAVINFGTRGIGWSGEMHFHVANQFEAMGTDEDNLSNLVFNLSQGAGSSKDIYINTDSLTLRDGAQIFSGAFDTGDSGNLNIVVNQLTLSGYTNLKSKEALFGSGLTSNSLSSKANAGKGGNIEIKARSLTLQDGGFIGADTFGNGLGGNIEIEANQISLRDGGIIEVDSDGSGNAGTIEIEASESLTLSGVANNGMPSAIYTDTFSQQTPAGKGGDIEIEARHLTLTDGGQITANTWGSGPGGLVRIKVTENLNISKSRIENQALLSQKFSETSGIFARAYGGDTLAGDAGSVLIQAKTIQIVDGGKIATSAVLSGGGHLEITANNRLYLRGSSLNTSVSGGIGNGGNITIGNPQFVVLDQSQIIAQADEGHGGNIHIVAQQFLKTPNSLISASSRVGLDGPVLIDSPAEKISGSLLALATTFTDLSGLLPRPCTELSFEEFINRSRFLVNPIAGSPPRPDDLKPSSLLLPIQASPNFTKAMESKEKKAELTQRLAWLTGCHQ